MGREEAGRVGGGCLPLYLPFLSLSPSGYLREAEGREGKGQYEPVRGMGKEGNDRGWEGKVKRMGDREGEGNR